MIIQRTRARFHTSIHVLKRASPKGAAATTRAPPRFSKRKAVLVDGKAWLESEGKKFDILTPRNWLHPQRPFPKNPWFVPEIPVGDATREEIYADYLSNPMQNTPRYLAQKYALSVLRIEAILRLKHLEKRQVSELGYVLQEELREKMEEMLGVGMGRRIQEAVDGRVREAKVVRPMFVLKKDPLVAQVGEAKRSESESHSEKKVVSTGEEVPVESFERRPDGNYIMALSGVLEPKEDPPVIMERQNPREQNRRWKFMIGDLSADVPVQERQVLVREHDGTLRTATRQEREMHLSLYPQESEQELNLPKTRQLWAV